LALAGGGGGIVFFLLVIYLFRPLIVQLVGVQFLIPPVLSILALSLGAQALALVSVALGALVPTLRISLMDPAKAMRK
jgi:ABC-type lipoprotein release transport system permease subunit